MKQIIPPKLKSGDTVAVIAPARSMGIISAETHQYALSRFADLGLNVVFGEHVAEKDDFNSSSIESRIDDLHTAFGDPSVKAVFTTIGGFNSNQLLDYIDWKLIAMNPKIFCGYSDITALANAIYAKTGLVTYSGPHFSTLGQKKIFEYTIDYLKQCLFSDKPIRIMPSNNWNDDTWYLDQDKRESIANPGWLTIHEGSAEGTIIGGNLCTLNLLQGTQYMPDLTNSILFIEDDAESQPHTFDRDLQSLIHLPNFARVKGLVIGRFQKASQMTDELLIQIIKTKKELAHLPVIANVDFGHTNPIITFPIGGKARMKASDKKSMIEIIEH